MHEAGRPAPHIPGAVARARLLLIRCRAARGGRTSYTTATTLQRQWRRRLSARGSCQYGATSARRPMLTALPPPMRTASCGIVMRRRRPIHTMTHHHTMLAARARAPTDAATTRRPQSVRRTRCHPKPAARANSPSATQLRGRSRRSTVAATAAVAAKSRRPRSHEQPRAATSSHEQPRAAGLARDATSTSSLPGKAAASSVAMRCPSRWRA